MTMSLVAAPMLSSEPKLTDEETLESLHQDAIGYNLASFKETAQRLALLGVPFSEVLLALGELDSDDLFPDECPSCVAAKTLDQQWDEAYEQFHLHVSDDLISAAATLQADLCMPLAEIVEMLTHCLSGDVPATLAPSEVGGRVENMPINPQTLATEPEARKIGHLPNTNPRVMCP
jgi:hypothetical protein